MWSSFLPRHGKGSPSELPPIIQNKGLVQNLLEQLGMVGPYRWRLVQSVQPVIIVAEQKLSPQGARRCFAAAVTTPTAALAGLYIQNKADSGVNIEVESIVGIVDGVTPAFELRIIAGTPLAGTGVTELYRDMSLPGSPAAAVLSVAAANGVIAAYQEANTNQGGRFPVGDLARLPPDNQIGLVTSAVFTGTVWITAFWTETPLD